jgi:hypothetical protein
MDWGPVPALARCRGIAGRLHGRAGGLWLAGAESAFPGLWPDELASTPPPSGGVGWLARLGRRLWPRTPPGTAAAGLPAPSPELIAVHGWLAQRNAAASLRWSAPLWRRAPVPLAAISEQGILWCLAAFRVERRRPFAAALIQELPLNTPATPGDCVALHLLIEELVPAVIARLRLQPRPSPGRRPGGLRSQAFMSAWPALMLQSDPFLPNWLAQGLFLFSAVRHWRRVLERLIAVSPLTRLVYADLISPVHHGFPWPPAPAPGRLSGAATSLQARTLFGSPDPDGRWHAFTDLWISHLARSALAAMLGPPASFELLQDAEAVLTSQERLWPMGSIRRLVAARSRRDRLVHAVNEEYVTRLAWLDGTLAQNDYFRLRFLDMLVRQIVAELSGPIGVEWARIGATADVEARDHFFFPGPQQHGPWCLLRFAQVLFGRHGLAGLAAGRVPALRRMLLALLPAGEPDAGELAARSGMPQRYCAALLARYGAQGVELPVRGATGHTPRYILSVWVKTLLNQLPAEQAVQVQRQVQVQVTEVVPG